MDAFEGHVGALDALVALVGSASRSDLAGPSRCPRWTSCEVLNHSMAVTLRIAQFASGETERQLLPDGDLVTSDPARSLGDVVATARRAWGSTDRSRVCHLSFGDFDAESAAGINMFDVLGHGWDISLLNDRSLNCEDARLKVGLDAARAVLGPRRDRRHYWPELVVGPGASGHERFLAYPGRR